MRLWNRVCRLVIGKDGAGLSVDQSLRITFEVVKTLDSKPNTATINVYNLTPENTSLITDSKDVFLSVGYEDGFGSIFTGNIKYTAKKHEGLDRYVEVYAGDGHNDYHNALTIVTLSKNTNDNSIVNACLQSMTNSKAGQITQLPAVKRVRGKVICKPTRDVLDNLAKNHDSNWSIQDNKVIMIKNSESLNGKVILIDNSVLLEQPTENENHSVTIKTKINPDYKINAELQLDNNLIIEDKPDLNAQSKPKSLHRRKHKVKTVYKKSFDGLYKIIKITYRGDTHGDTWDAELEVVSI